MTEFTIKRTRWIHKIMCGDTVIGEVWKDPGRHSFTVKLHGIFWRNGEPNRKGGTSAETVRRLKDAVPLAVKTFTDLGLQ